METMPGGGVSAGCIDVVGLAMMWSTIPIRRSHWSRSGVKDAILDHKCHGTVSRDIQEQGITFLYDMRKLTFITFARPHRSGQACVPFTIVSQETRSLSLPNLVPFYWNVRQVLDPKILIKLFKTPKLLSPRAR